MWNYRKSPGLSTSPLLSNNVINPFLAPLHFFFRRSKAVQELPGMGVPGSRPERSHTAGRPPAPDTGLRKPVSAWKSRDWALCEGCQVCAEFVHGSERWWEESPTGVALRRGRVIEPGAGRLLCHEGVSTHGSLATRLSRASSIGVPISCASGMLSEA